jgi:hypothetical protein
VCVLSSCDYNGFKIRDVLKMSLCKTPLCLGKLGAIGLSVCVLDAGGSTGIDL